MKNIFWSKFKESAWSILPISCVIMILTAIFIPNCKWTIFCFGLAIICLMIGISLFSMGNEIGLMKIGGHMGSSVSKSKKIGLMLICSFLIGSFVTIAESDLTILATQIPGINNWVFIITVGISVGFCMLLATLRVVLNIKIQYVLIVGYVLVFVLMFFTSKEFLPIAFDASGVTTGAVSVPFIMSFGLGIGAVRAGDNNQDDSFGMVAICSLGPIFAVMLMSIILKNAGAVSADLSHINYNSCASVFTEFGLQLLENMKDVALILAPICLMFVIYNATILKLPKQALLRIFVGVLYSYVGITLFFVGAQIGFLPVASELAMKIYDVSPYLCIPIATLVGIFIIIAEPAVGVLNKQVEELSSGTISRKKMQVVMSIGVTFACLLSVIRVLFAINILYILAPIVAIIVILAIFSPSKITAIAFDSGGIAAGVLSSTFVIPFMQGLCVSRGLNFMAFGFGSVGIIIMMPILVVEIMGIKMRLAEKHKAEKAKKLDKRQSKITIIEFD